MGLFLLFLVHFTENSLFCVLISPATKKEETLSSVNTGVDKDSMTRIEWIPLMDSLMDSFNVLPRSVRKNVLIRKKKVDSFKAASSQNPYIRTNWFVHTAVTTEISMHIT